MSNLCVIYNKILGLLHELEPQDNIFNQIRIPKLSDKQLPTIMASQINHSIFNRWRHQLMFKIEYFRQRIVPVLAPRPKTTTLWTAFRWKFASLAVPSVPAFARRPTAQKPMILLRGAQGTLLQL